MITNKKIWVLFAAIAATFLRLFSARKQQLKKRYRRPLPNKPSTSVHVPTGRPGRNDRDNTTMPDINDG